MISGVVDASCMDVALPTSVWNPVEASAATGYPVLLGKQCGSRLLGTLSNEFDHPIAFAGIDQLRY